MDIKQNTTISVEKIFKISQLNLFYHTRFLGLQFERMSSKFINNNGYGIAIHKEKIINYQLSIIYFCRIHSNL